MSLKLGDPSYCGILVAEPGGVCALRDLLFDAGESAGSLTHLLIWGSLWGVTSSWRETDRASAQLILTSQFNVNAAGCELGDFSLSRFALGSLEWLRTKQLLENGMAGAC